jgi:carnitine O-acetyltransferase
LNESIIYKHQKDLPRLPVPDLQVTCQNYLNSIQCLVSSQDYQHTLHRAQEFMKPEGIGERLQQRLLERAAHASTSWLEDWWNHYAYFAYREPTAINVNYFYHFADPILTTLNHVDIQLREAAFIMDAALQFRELILTETLEPDYIKGRPLSMDQYRYLFHSCRIPTLPVDFTKVYDPVKHAHIVVAIRGQFYTFSLVHRDGTRLTFEELER